MKWRRGQNPKGGDAESWFARIDWSQSLSWKSLTVLAPTIALVVLHVLVFPPARETKRLQFETGSISDREVLAPFSFTAPRPRNELDVARRDAAQRVEPVYRVLEGAEGRTEQRLRELLRRVEELAAVDSVAAEVKLSVLREQRPGVSREAWELALSPAHFSQLRESLERVVRRNLAAGIIDATPRGTYARIHVLDSSDMETTREVGSVVLGYRLAEGLQSEFRSELRDVALAQAAAEIARAVLVPNLSYDDAETERRRQTASASVPTEREYARNERILEAGVRVSEDDNAVFAALNEAWGQRELAQDRTIGLRLLTGRVVLLLALLLGLALLLRASDRRILESTPRTLLVITLLGLHVALAALVLSNPSWGGGGAVPVVLLAMLTTILFGDGAGARITIIGLLLLAIVPGTAMSAIAVWAATGGAAIRMVRRVRHRNQFYRAMLVISVAGVLVAGGSVLASGGGWSEALNESARTILAGVASTALALFLLPLFEALFGVTTELTILELSDLNHPLLRRMSLESPGTYHHSQVVGTLAEAGARAIGANALVARVGANFHDIGKMLKPKYYAENQSETNAHDELSPSMSALVIAAHVKDGIELGRQWGLPPEVLAYIPEHHGTSVMQYFYRKALEREDGETVKVDDFRYPGPKPQSRETAIVMLADGIEASTRSLRRVTPSRVREMVRKIIDKRMEDGELDECGLSLSDLAQVREAFVPILVGIHHQRVAYPGQRAHEEKKEQESLEARSRTRRGGSTVATGG